MSVITLCIGKSSHAPSKEVMMCLSLLAQGVGEALSEQLDQVTASNAEKTRKED